ncbi:hypothetical protein P3X46_024988 [Hevea brasiliensis]|uniref:Transmembrane protein n=1 Tax=Hevea brasiliensis TaxID=3981 RepID=A0ABQ9L7R0_HEVBR|nr:hypothetical protein P3X46_024988 [Hevea brasiliensis]
MGRESKSIITLFSTLLVGFLLVSTSILHGTEARLLLSTASMLHEEIEGVVKGLSLAAVKKSGPSPGIGHRYKNFQTLGVVKHSGPAPGAGHKYVTGNNS